MKEQNFKQTEIGKIPVDWEVMKLQSICNFQNGVGHEQFESENGKYIVVNSKFISTENRVKRFCNKDLVPLLKNDITIVMSDIPNGKALAKCYIIEKDNCYSLNQRIGRIVISEFSAKFYFYYLNRNKYFLSFDSGSGQTNLRKQEVLDCPIIVPPLSEQEKIAEVLSDTDLWIESTEALLAKKRQIKKGAMQKLLSPKEDWEVKSIIEIINNDRKLFNDGDWVESVHIKSDEIRLLQTGNIGIGKFLDRASKKYISEESFKQLNCKEVFENDILICRLAEPAGRCCLMPKIDEKKLIVSVDVSILRPDEKLYDRRFLVFIMCTDEWFNNVTEKVGGTTHKRISRSNLGEIKFSLPPLKIQREIAEILSSMDLEIESLENRLQKARQLKQGMMQDLLTGKVRLV